MFTQILYTHFKWTRPLIATFAVLTFALPTMLWRVGAADTYGNVTAMQVVSGFGALGPSLALVAILSGFLIVAYVWSIDAAARHVYPLSLPLSWPRFVSLRYVTGALSLTIPAVTLWFGCLLVLSMIDLPSTLRAYPGTLALRFFLGTMLAYSLTFAAQYLLGRRAVMTFGILIGAGAAVTLLLQLLSADALLVRAIQMLTSWPGPFAVFSADWALVDV